MLGKGAEQIGQQHDRQTVRIQRDLRLGPAPGAGTRPTALCPTCQPIPQTPGRPSCIGGAVSSVSMLDLSFNSSPRCSASTQLARSTACFAAPPPCAEPGAS